MKKILVVYYTQSGQLKTIVDKILSPLSQNNTYTIDYFKIEPIDDFPFPWTNDTFYDCMPESVEGITIPVKAFDKQGDYDLIILAYQVWFLSLSIPFWSMLQDKKLKALLNHNNVITILGIRNMWVNAQKRLLNYFKANKVNHVGNLVFADPNSNIISVITVLKFLTTGKKKPYKNLPPYGITKQKLETLTKFGELMELSLSTNNWSGFQEGVVKNKGVSLKFSIKTTEMAAGRIFKLWAAFIRKKGGPGNPDRKVRLKIYEYYLLFLIFFISPISSSIFSLAGIVFYPLTKKGMNRILLMQRK